jgi:hypothetical protein
MIKILQEDINNIYKKLGMFMHKNEMTFSSYHLAKAIGQLPDSIHTMITKNKTTKDKIKFIEVINLKLNKAPANCLFQPDSSTAVCRELSAEDINRNGKASSNLYLFNKSQARLLISFSSTQHKNAVEIKIQVNNLFDKLEELLQKIQTEGYVLNDNMTLEKAVINKSEAIKNVNKLFDTIYNFMDVPSRTHNLYKLKGKIRNAIYIATTGMTAYQIALTKLKETRKVPEVKVNFENNYYTDFSAIRLADEEVIDNLSDSVKHLIVKFIEEAIEEDPEQEYEDRIIILNYIIKKIARLNKNPVNYKSVPINYLNKHFIKFKDKKRTEITDKEIEYIIKNEPTKIDTTILITDDIDKE